MEFGTSEEAGSSDPGRGFENPLLLNKYVNASCFLYKTGSALRQQRSRRLFRRHCLPFRPRLLEGLLSQPCADGR